MAAPCSGYRGLVAFLPDQDIGIAVLWNSESSSPSAFLPTWMDRALGVPGKDWLGLNDAAGESAEAAQD